MELSRLAKAYVSSLGALWEVESEAESELLSENPYSTAKSVTGNERPVFSIILGSAARATTALACEQWRPGLLQVIVFLERCKSSFSEEMRVIG